jgi:hypothetical protein
MIGQWLIAVLCTGAIAGAGLPVALRLAPAGSFRLVAAWLLGSCLVPAALLAGSVLGARFSRPELAVLWLALVVAGCCLLLARQPGIVRSLRYRISLPRDIDLLTALCLAVCLFQTTYVVLVAVRVPLSSYDAWSVWEYRGRRFWMDGVVSAHFLHSTAAIFAHPAYPPTLPLLMTWIYIWIGADTPVYMKLIFPSFYVALLLAFYHGIRASQGQRVAVLATAALALVPRITEYAGTGLADAPLTAFVVAGVAAYVMGRGRPIPVVPLAGVLLGLAPLSKREGLFFLLAAAVSIAWRERSLYRAVAWLWPAPLLALPWYLYVAHTGVPDRDFLSYTPANLLSHLDRAAVVGRFFAINMLAVNEWLVLWFVLAGVLCLAALHRCAAGLWLLPMVALPLILYVFALSMSAWPDYLLHTRTSLDRLILVTTPFALWIVVEQVAALPLSRQRPAARARQAPAPESGR